MKAVVLPRYGGIQDLESTDVPEPPHGPNEVLIALKATSVNPVDWKVGAGYLDSFLPGEFPLIPGWDAAGTIVETGSAVTGCRVGDDVLGYVRRPVVKWGTYAEYTVAEPGMIAPKPDVVDWETAAALPLVGLTALQSLDAVRVKQGDTVLVHAAAGGVGSVAVQIAKARGARVIGTASTSNHDYLLSLGVEPVEYGNGLLERLRGLAPDGIDSALDAVGRGEVDLSIEAGADPGRVVSIADPAVREKGGKYVFVEPNADDLRTLTDLIEAKRLTVPVTATFPLDRAAEAWEASQTGRTRGKIVLTIA
ncbi:NADP-dependent oxidoreductase [Glycomyces sp. L485]|uniref:NADP-dependent oxidoreductase n=1 Tax=Glycomyces sp. L485 TaxID=2909235 RepID=UPI001F4A6ADE|nr:NADP-dependent oxidoreductase [Glycomyces sp. L485]MCH7230126.1 NADP-dependent oxidoreductase [Glycomyces sp. L485]